MNTVLLGALAIVLFPAASGEILPDFNGRWIAVEPESVAGHELCIVQDDSTLTLERVQLGFSDVYDTLGRRIGDARSVREVTTYRLDGAAAIAVRADADPQQVRSSARWEGDRLVLSDLYTATGLRFQRSLALDAHGRLVLTQPLPVGEIELAIRAERVLQPTRIVFERR